MRTSPAIAVLVLALSGCGIESIFTNAGHAANERPASKLTGKLAFATGTVTITDAEGKVLEPFQSSMDGGTYEVRLPSAKYSNLVAIHTVGTSVMRALVPSVGEESAVAIDIDARSTTEAIISEARLSADGSSWKKVTPEVYVATRDLIRAAFDVPGPTADLLKYVGLVITGGTDPTMTGDPVFFLVPVLTPTYTVTTSPLLNGWLDRVRFDYVGDGKRRGDSADFDAKLVEVAKLYRPAGCPDVNNVRVMFTVNFNANAKNGNCGVGNRFTWAVDKPGKSMYFVGWIHKESPYQDANFNPPTTVNALIGASNPNQIPMHDDGQGGDEVAGDGIWTVYFDLPRGLRMGYKYTWGFRGNLWNGTEEWPGNSRIIQLDDLDGNDIIYRRDVFGDEATNKDNVNLSQKGKGSITWDTILRPEFGIEAREQPVDTDNDCHPNGWLTPASIGPLTVKCTQ